MNNSPIGVFDSGVGGLTTVTELQKLLPNESIVYFGDTDRTPYGSKLQSTIIEYCREIVDFLLSKNVKIIVIACNTATAYALETLQSEYDVPIFGIIKHGAVGAVGATKNNRVGLLATNGTVQSKSYHKQILELNSDIDIFAKGCPAFVSLVEEGFSDHKGTELIAVDYIKEVIDSDIDTLILGCTHFPLMRNCIKNVIPKHITLIDPSVNTCRVLSEYLAKENLCCDDKSPVAHKFYMSGDCHKFQEVCHSIGFKLEGEVSKW